MRRLIEEDNAYRKTEAFKKLSAEQRQMHDQEFWDLEGAGEIDAEIKEIETRIFLRKLSKCGIPIPSRHDEKSRDKYWEANFYGEHRMLSQEGYYELNKMLRDERKARREDSILWWIPILTALSGLLGSLIGVLSILKNWNR